MFLPHAACPKPLPCLLVYCMQRKDATVTVAICKHCFLVIAYLSTTGNSESSNWGHYIGQNGLH